MQESVLKEMELKLIKNPFVPRTLYFGGGTPSLVETGFIEKIIKKLAEYCDVSELREVTLEANPDDITPEKLSAWKSAGVNRLSIGIQSFFDEHLKWMNRAHNSFEAEKSLELAAKYGFEISMDLIYGIPMSDSEQHLSNLKKALSFPIVHLSCYGLTMEENTPWKKLIDRGKAPLPDDDKSSLQFDLTMSYLQSRGWRHYEISNYCLPGKEALHNSSYWENKPYIGIGPSAHSFDGQNRYWNISDNKAYVEALENGEIPQGFEKLSSQNKFNEYVMTSLRTSNGMRISKLEDFELEYSHIFEHISRYQSEGMVLIGEDRVKLSNKGKHFADAVAASLFV